MKKPAPHTCRLCRLAITETPYLLVIHNGEVGHNYFHPECWMGPIPINTFQKFSKYMITTVRI